ncbi:hypothetical protein SprV_0200955500 [Sparganum proliferum]
MDVPKAQFSPRGLCDVRQFGLPTPCRHSEKNFSTRPNHGILRRCLTFHVHPTRLGARRATQTPRRKVLRNDRAAEDPAPNTALCILPTNLLHLRWQNIRTNQRNTHGFPISSLVAKLVLQELEKVAFSHYKPAFWRRYVDDTFVIIEKDKLSGFQDLLNSIFPDIQFTREDEEDEKLPFLDVLVTRTPDGKLSTTMYRKATNTTQVLNYHSNHPLVHKRGCVRALFDRVKTHCSEPERRMQELRHLRDQLTKNGYPNSFTSRCIRTHPRRTNGRETPTIWHSLPYIKNVSEATERIASELGVGITHHPAATMRSKIMKMKDRLDAGEQSGVVYQIPCRNCPCHYTGQTGRCLSSRILEHKRAVRKGDPLSEVVTHTLEEGHEFDFASTRILARAGNKTGRELLEAWVSDANSINRHIDLPACYHSLRPRSQVAQLTPSRSTNGVTTPGDHRGQGGTNLT